MRGINFRPKVDPGKLLQIAKKQHYSDLSGFINDAIEEKIRHIHEDPRDHKLVGAIKKAVYEYNGWTFSKPPMKEAVKIKKKAEAMRSGKEKSIPLSDIIHKLEKIPNQRPRLHSPR
jgi:hypothetical protein